MHIDLEFIAIKKEKVMQKKSMYFYMALLLPTTVFGAGSAPEASLDDGVKHKVNIYGTLILHTNPTTPIPVEHITFNRQIERIFMYIKPEEKNADGGLNYEIKIPDATKTQKKIYELNVNPTQAYDKVDLVSKDPQGNIRIETVEITAPEPDAIWVYKSGARKYEYIEVVATSNMSNKKRHYLVELRKEIICDAKEAAGEIRGGAKIPAIKSLKIEGFTIENDNNNKKSLSQKNSRQKLKTAKSDIPKNRSMRIVKSS